MDIEHLTKTQIVLLTLLVSFVTSIATGIVTVSLMQQAPPAIAQTVNRIVERTVEKVVPAAQTAAVIQEKTVVIKESDLIAEALSVIKPSLVRVYSAKGENPVLLSLGLVLDRSGSLVADASGLAEAQEVDVVQSGGQHVRASVLKLDRANGLAYLTTSASSSDGKAVVWSPAKLIRKDAALGETVFTISGKDLGRLSNGIVTSLGENGSGGGYVDTNVDASSLLPGSSLWTTDGEVMGISSGVSKQIAAAAFIPVSAFSPAEVPTGDSQKK